MWLSDIDELRERVEYMEDMAAKGGIIPRQMWFSGRPVGDVLGLLKIFDNLEHPEKPNESLSHWEQGTPTNLTGLQTLDFRDKGECPLTGFRRSEMYVVIELNHCGLSESNLPGEDGCVQIVRARMTG
ncbi:hypothetical protein N7456_001713 [Penicillium angulare]|uniref:Uncharacterized protein n=1 Tax=Penicillium angulare TaxID=116970 RepID=A0A9W9G725_9EURO|nr:hypothetical protein N7456_001713 [Penicillium angulare]